MIPLLGPDGALPPGIHDAEGWEVVVAQFGGTARRDELLAKLRLGLNNLRDAGCPWVLLDGSFVTDKPEPNDVDGCWQYEPGVNRNRIDPCFHLLRPIDRMLQKAKYGMDFYRADVIEAGSGRPFPEFFQFDRQNRPRGIVRLNLAAELLR